MRSLLGVLLLALGVLAGRSAALGLQRRSRALELTQRLLLALKLALEYSGAPLGVLLRSLSRREDLRGFSFLERTLALMEEGTPLPRAFCAAASAQRGILGAQGSALLCRLGSMLGTTDKQGQLELLERELASLAVLQEEARRDRQKNAGLYRAAGAFAGFAAFILLV